MNDRGMGWLPTPVGTLARLIGEGRVMLAAKKPGYVQPTDNVSCAHFWTRRKYQYSTSMCTGFSAVHVGVTSYKKSGFDVDLSPASVYSPICGGRDAGSNIGDACEAMQKYGVFRSGLTGIDDTDWRTAYKSKWWQKPDSELAKDASEHILLEWKFCGDDVDTFLAEIDTGLWCGQAAFGVDVYRFDTDKNGSVGKWRGDGLNHAMFLTGGRKINPDTGKMEREAGNSWSDWGENSLFYFEPYDWLDHRGQELWLARAMTIPADAMP